MIKLVFASIGPWILSLDGDLVEFILRRSTVNAVMPLFPRVPEKETLSSETSLTFVLFPVNILPATIFDGSI